MPELPEVETIVRGLRKGVVGREIVDVWTDWPKYFRSSSESGFRKCVLRRTIRGLDRRGKNILFFLSHNQLLLIHQKLSGHLMVGKWVRNKVKSQKFKVQSFNVASRHILEDQKFREAWADQEWVPEPFSGALADPMNRFIRLIFFLDNGEMIAFSDIRRFGKVLCGPEELILNLPDLKDLGPEPLSTDFSYAVFHRCFQGRRGYIKQLLLDQSVIVGIGNIYADEILWESRIHPLRKVETLDEKDFRLLYKNMRSVLRRAIRFRGSSVGDYRDSGGKEGGYERFHRVYQHTGLSCFRCNTPIVRIKIGVRSAHFCPECQKN